MMRTLVTGASGYLGPYIVQELVQGGHEVTALVRSPARLGPLARHPRVQLVVADLEDERAVAAALEGQEACIHAALIWGEPGDELEARDTATTIKLFEAAGRAGVRRCLHVSSTAVHRPFRQRMSEDDRLTTADIYGATKAAGELFLWAACAAHEMEGLVVRAGPIVGPPAFAGAAFRSPSQLERFARAAVRGEPIRVQGGLGRQFVAAADVAMVLGHLLTSTHRDETYLCLDRQLTLWEDLARLTVQLAGSGSAVLVEEHMAMSVPTFDTSKLLRHHGFELDGSPALRAHIEHLIGIVD